MEKGVELRKRIKEIKKRMEKIGKENQRDKKEEKEIVGEESERMIEEKEEIKDKIGEKEEKQIEVKRMYELIGDMRSDILKKKIQKRVNMDQKIGREVVQDEREKMIQLWSIVRQWWSLVVKLKIEQFMDEDLFEIEEELVIKLGEKRFMGEF